MEFLDGSQRLVAVPPSPDPVAKEGLGRRLRGRLSAVIGFPFRTRRRRIVITVLLIFVLGFLGLFVLPVSRLYTQAQSLKNPVSEIQEALTKKDLSLAETAVGELKIEVDQVTETYRWLSYLKLVPFLNRYFEDGQHLLTSGQLSVDAAEKVVAALKPHADVLGLSSGFGNHITNEQQLAKLVETLPEMAADLDRVWEDVNTIKVEMDAIDPQRYPEDFRGVNLRFWISEVQSVLAEVEPILIQGKQILELAPGLLGSPQRTYLVLFQNDAELRPTGGFITGFSLMKLRNGKVVSNDFHSGSYVARTTPYISPPRVLSKYLGVRTWHFQDGNLSPDFPTSANKLLEMWRLSGLAPVAGVVGITTRVAANLLEVTGPLRVAGYDRDFSGYTGLPELCRQGGRDFTSGNLVCRLEYYVERAGRGGAETRKIILDRISDALIEKVSKSSAEIWPKLVDFAFENLAQKNVMIYATNQREQALVKSLGWAGEVRSSAGDYLYISDSNFGGFKSNLFMREDAELKIEELKNGQWRHTLKLSYFNPQPYDHWLSSNYRDFVRVYVPKGSRLVAVEGAVQIWTDPNSWANKIQNPNGWSEFGRTVFGAYFTLWPEKEGYSLTFVYDTPAAGSTADDYSLLLQKQSATNIGLVTVKIGDTMKSVDLATDQEIRISLER